LPDQHRVDGGIAGAASALNGTGRIACRRIEWRWADNFISISRFA
jgi:hypothetical protein